MKRLGLLAVLILTLTVGVVASTASAAPKSAAVPVDVTGTIDKVPFAGTLTVDRVVRSGDGLAAVGTLAAPGLGSPQNVTVPLQASGTCDILHLTLGPLDLNLLGLVVHLDQVNLDITAEQGSGNLLGNLLCAVSGLLDPPTGGGGGGLTGILNGIAALLTRILGALG